MCRYGAPPTLVISPRLTSSAATVIGSAGFTLGVQVENRRVDGLVGRAVEVMALDDLHDVGDGVLGEQHAAQDGLLGVEILRRHPLEAGRATVPAALPAALVLLVAPFALSAALTGNGQTVAGTDIGPGVVQRLGNAHRATSSRPLRGPSRATLSYGTAPTNKTPDSGSGASSSGDFQAGTECGRRTTVGRSAPSANLVIHRACGRRTRCCGEPLGSCARTGGQHCGQTHTGPAKPALTWPFSIHWLWGRKTFALSSRSPESPPRPAREPTRCKDLSHIASLTCGRLD